MIAVFSYEAQHKWLKYTDHYLAQLLTRDMPDENDIQKILCDDDPQVIEPNRNDDRGPSFLVWGIIDSRAGHILLSSPPEPCWVITSYWPDTEPTKWEDNFKRRRSIGV
tara:strand:- start:179 stop:505 length:327 start_codon:yes stop_codon:yes gene_type:complete